MAKQSDGISPKIMTPKQRSRQSKQLGDSAGIATTGVVVSEDYNNKLTGIARIKVYDQMRLGDGTAKAMIQIIKLPIRAARWRIEPASEKRNDKKIAEFISDQLFKNETRTWDEILNEALVYLDYGSLPLEIVLNFKMVGEQVMIGLHKLARIRPDTIQSWKLQNGENGIQQFTINGSFEIPMEKMIVFINDREGENWEGISIFRAAYKHWYMKDKVYLIDAIAHERQGLGVPYGKLPVGSGDADEAKMDEVLQNMRANEKAYARFPSDWEIGFMDMKGGATRNPKDTIMHHDRQMTKSILAQFLELGSGGGGGSHALGKDQSSFYLMSIEAIAKNIKDTFNRFLIKKLVDLNFDVEGNYPELVYDAIGQKDVNIFTTALQRAVQTGVIVPDDALERVTREMMDLPESEGELADPSMLDEGNAELEAEMAELEMLMDGGEAEEEISEEVEPEEVTASYKELSTEEFIASYGEEVLEVLKAARRPTSDETKKKISEALKRYWSTRKSSGKGKGKKGKKKRNPELTKRRKAARGLRKELREFNDKNKRELLEMKAKGEKLNEQDKAKRELAIFEKRKSLRDKISKLKDEIQDIKDKEADAEEAKAPKAPKIEKAKEPTNSFLLKMSEQVSKLTKVFENDKS